MTSRLDIFSRSKNGRDRATSVHRSSAGCSRSTGQTSNDSGGAKGAEARNVRKKPPGIELPPARGSVAITCASFGLFVTTGILMTRRIGTGKPCRKLGRFTSGGSTPGPTPGQRAPPRRTAGSHASAKQVATEPRLGGSQETCLRREPQRILSADIQARPTCPKPRGRTSETPKPFVGEAKIWSTFITGEWSMLDRTLLAAVTLTAMLCIESAGAQAQDL